MVKERLKTPESEFTLAAQQTGTLVWDFKYGDKESSARKALFQVTYKRKIVEAFLFSLLFHCLLFIINDFTKHSRVKDNVPLTLTGEYAWKSALNKGSHSGQGY